MNNNNHSVGTLTRSGNVLRLENALVEEVYSDSLGSGCLIASYGMPGRNGLINVELIRLNVSRNTKIRNQAGATLNLRDIRQGMRVNAILSPAVTRSIPPQAAALEITALAAAPSTNVTTGRVMSVDARNGVLMTGNPRDVNSQMKFIVNDSTVITNQNGRRIRLADIRPGQTVRVEHANFQTMSIPPQTTAFGIKVF